MRFQRVKTFLSRLCQQTSAQNRRTDKIKNVQVTSPCRRHAGMFGAIAGPPHLHCPQTLLPIDWQLKTLQRVNEIKKCRFDQRHKYATNNTEAHFKQYTYHGLPIQSHGLVSGDGFTGALLVATVRVGLALDRGHNAARPGETQVPIWDKNNVR